MILNFIGPRFGVDYFKSFFDVTGTPRWGTSCAALRRGVVGEGARTG